MLPSVTPLTVYLTVMRLSQNIENYWQAIVHHWHLKAVCHCQTYHITSTWQECLIESQRVVEKAVGS